MPKTMPTRRHLVAGNLVESVGTSDRDGHLPRSPADYFQAVGPVGLEPTTRGLKAA